MLGVKINTNHKSQITVHEKQTTNKEKRSEILEWDVGSWLLVTGCWDVGCENKYESLFTNNKQRTKNIEY